MKTIQFDDKGKISNIDELFGGHDACYGTMDRAGNEGRSIEAWLNEEDKVVNGSDDHYFIWGKVLVGQGRNTYRKNIEGTHNYYRIHSTSDSVRAKATKNNAAGCIE